MGLGPATTAGLVIWIVLCSLGYSGLDAGLLALVVYRARRRRPDRLR